MVNPDVQTSSNIFIPILIYSIDPTTQGKNNYELFDSGIYIRDDALQEGINLVTTDA